MRFVIRRTAHSPGRKRIPPARRQHGVLAALPLASVAHRPATAPKITCILAPGTVPQTRALPTPWFLGIAKGRAAATVDACLAQSRRSHVGAACRVPCLKCFACSRYVTVATSNMSKCLPPLFPSIRYLHLILLETRGRLCDVSHPRIARETYMIVTGCRTVPNEVQLLGP